MKLSIATLPVLVICACFLLLVATTDNAAVLAFLSTQSCSASWTCSGNGNTAGPVTSEASCAAACLACHGNESMYLCPDFNEKAAGSSVTNTSASTAVKLSTTTTNATSGNATTMAATNSSGTTTSANTTTTTTGGSSATLYECQCGRFDSFGSCNQTGSTSRRDLCIDAGFEPASSPVSPNIPQQTSAATAGAAALLMVSVTASLVHGVAMFV
jgi:hypothetical protein